MTLRLKTMANNGSGVSTMERDELTLTMSRLFGMDTARFELAVFAKGNLLFDDIADEELENLPEEDVTPTHVQYFDTLEEAEDGHRDVVNAINAGTLVYSGVPEKRR